MTGREPSPRFALAIAAALLAFGMLGAPPCTAQQVVNACRIAPRSQCGNADLTGTSLQEAELTKANLYNANLVRADLRGANLQGANLTHATLVRADLSGADLRGALLVNAQLGFANLTGANLTGAVWSNGHTCAQGSIGTCK